jgi:phage FluMu gp28-like protein
MAAVAAIAIWVKARQIGFSHTIAADAVRRALTEHSTNIILSASQELSTEVLNKAKAHARVLMRFGYEAAKPIISNASRIVFGNGGRVIALPANPRTARSYTGNVYFDEAAYHADLRAIWDAAAAMSTRGASSIIRIVSTPNGAQGLYYDWVTHLPEGWVLDQVTVDEAIRQGMRVDLDRLWQLAGGDERIFQQWYRCQFLDAQLQYIPTAMADRALHWAGSVPDLTGAEIHAGLDVGRTQDLTALVVVALVRGVAWVLAVMTCRRTKFRAQRQMVREARELFRWQTLHVDATGIGAQLAEEMVFQWGEHEVVPVEFTLQSKEDLATRALRWFRDDRIRFPKHSGGEGQRLRDETISIQRVITPSGNVTYEAPRNTQGHADRFWALTLALKGAGEPPAPRGLGQEPLLVVP